MRAHFYGFLLCLVFVLPPAAAATDTDGDGTPDERDICKADSLAPEPHGCDTDFYDHTAFQNILGCHGLA